MDEFLSRFGGALRERGGAVPEEGGAAPGEGRLQIELFSFLSPLILACHSSIRASLYAFRLLSSLLSTDFRTTTSGRTHDYTINSYIYRYHVVHYMHYYTVDPRYIRIYYTKIYDIHHYCTIHHIYIYACTCLLRTCSCRTSW